MLLASSEQHMHIAPRPGMSREVNQAARVAEISAELVPRLQRVCAHFADDDFKCLVWEIAEMQDRFEQSGGKETVATDGDVDTSESEPKPLDVAPDKSSRTTTDEHYVSRLLEVIAGLTTRLRPAYADMPEARFHALIATMAATKIRSEVAREKPRRDALLSGKKIV